MNTPIPSTFHGDDETIAAIERCDHLAYVQASAYLIAEKLDLHGHASIDFCPGDMTLYELAIVDRGKDPRRYAVSVTNFGTSMTYDDLTAIDCTYWTQGGVGRGLTDNHSSAAILALFLHLVGRALKVKATNVASDNLAHLLHEAAAS